MRFLVLLALLGLTGCERAYRVPEAEYVVLQCKAEQYDVYQRIRELGYERWVLACIKAMPEDTPIDELSKRCSIQLKPCA